MDRIVIVDTDNSIDGQARAYAEYRTFAVLAHHTRGIRRDRVFLRRIDVHGGCDKATCAVTVALEPSGSFRIRTSGPHVYAAINRAVGRLRTALGRRVEQRLSSHRHQDSARMSPRRRPEELGQAFRMSRGVSE